MLLKQLLALTMLPSSNQTLVVSEMNFLRDDWIPSREPHFRKEVYVVFYCIVFCLVRFSMCLIVICFLAWGFELWKYVNDSIISDTILKGQVINISRSLSTCSPRSNIEWDELQGNEVSFGTNGTPHLNLIVINDKPFDVASRAKILSVNISSDLKRNHHIVHCQKLGTRWRLHVCTEAIMAANSYKKIYGDMETCSNISIMSLRIFGARLETC